MKLSIDEHARSIVIQGTECNGGIVLEVKCLTHPGDVLALIDTARKNAWWSTIDEIVRSHLSE